MPDTALDPADVVLWWHAGVRSDEATDALAAGWSLDETLLRHPAVVERNERKELKGRDAEARRARSEAESRRLGDAMRVREETERAQRDRRRSAVDGVDLQVDIVGSAIRFSIAVSDPTYWAIEVGKGKWNELGESGSLEDCLELVAERVSQIGGTICEVACKQIGPEELLAASDAIAHLCERQVVFRLERPNRRRPSDVRLATVDECDDIYDDDGDDGRWGDSRNWSASGAGLLVARRVSVDNAIVLLPALPEAWPGFICHSDVVVSVGRLFLIPDAAGEGWDLIGPFDTSIKGVAAAEEVINRRHDGSDKSQETRKTGQMQPEFRPAQVTVDLVGADVVARRGVIRGYSGFTWWREGSRLLADESTGSTEGRTCAQCSDPAVLQNYESDEVWFEQCSEHGYEGTWMTSDEFNTKLELLKSQGATSGEVFAFWNYGHRRVRD